MSDETEGRFVIEVRGQHEVIVQREKAAVDPDPAGTPRVHKLKEAIEDALGDIQPLAGEANDDYREDIYGDSTNIPNAD